MTPTSLNEWLRLAAGPVVAIGLVIYLSITASWQPYEPPVVVLLFFGPSLAKGPGKGPDDE